MELVSQNITITIDPAFRTLGTLVGLFQWDVENSAGAAAAKSHDIWPLKLPGKLNEMTAAEMECEARRNSAPISTGQNFGKEFRFFMDKRVRS